MWIVIFVNQKGVAIICFGATNSKNFKLTLLQSSPKAYGYMRGYVILIFHWLQNALKIQNM